MRNFGPSRGADAETIGKKVPRRKYASHGSRLPCELPSLGLGCSSFSTFFASDDEAPLTVDNMSRGHAAVKGWVETIRHAILHRGITLLDTAPWYGHGTSEITIGYALSDLLVHEDGAVGESRIHRSSIVTNTKVGRYEADPKLQFDFTYDATMNSVQRSLRRCCCRYFDVIQIHDPEFATSLSELKDETIPALVECRRKGWCKAIGITGYPLAVQHELLVSCNMNSDDTVFDQSLVYCHNNLHDMSLYDDQAFLWPNEMGRMSFAECCQKGNVKLMAAAPLSMGLLTCSGPPSWHPASQALRQACASAAQLCESQEVDIASLALLYALSQQEVGCVLLGMKDIQQVNVAADLALRFDGIDLSKCRSSILDTVLTSTEKSVLERLLDRTVGPFANVWSSGEFRWDGVAEAKKHWALVESLKNG